MTRMVNVMVLPAGSAPIRLERIDGDDYHQLNRLVQGNLGTCPLPPSLRNQDFYAFCDDDALIRSDQPEPNRWATHLGQYRLAGPIVIVRTDQEGETLGLRRQDVAALEMYFAQEPSAEAVHLARNSETWWRLNQSGFSIGSLDQ